MKNIILSINSDSFKKEVLEEDRPVLLACICRDYDYMEQTGVLNSVIEKYGKDLKACVFSDGFNSMLKGLGIEGILSCDTYNQSKLTELVRASLAVKGLSVVIARHPCMLKFTRQKRKQPGFVQAHVDIDQDICTQTRDCVERFGCPTFTRKPGGSVFTHPDLCIGDGSCR